MGLSNHAGAFGCPNNCKLMNFANDSGTSVGLMMYLVVASNACSCAIPASSRAVLNRSDDDVRKSSMSFCARAFALWSRAACSIVPADSRKVVISLTAVSWNEPTSTSASTSPISRMTCSLMRLSSVTPRAVISVLADSMISCALADTTCSALSWMPPTLPNTPAAGIATAPSYNACFQLRLRTSPNTAVSLMSD